MHSSLKAIVMAAACAGLVACGGEKAAQTSASSAEQAAPETVTETAEIPSEAKVAAVLIYADWCSSCKIIDPKLKAVQAGEPIEGLEHVVLDYTSRDQDAMLASADAMGVGKALRAHYANEELKTGLVLLVDMENQVVVDDLRKELSAQVLRSSMAASVAAL